MENFLLVFPKDAERMEFADLSEEIQKAIGEGSTQNPDNHAAYRFCLFVKMLPDGSARKRERRRRAYDQADRVLINLMTPSPLMKLSGIYPPTETIKVAPSGEGEISAGIITPVFSLNLHGLLKDLARRRGQHILAGHNDREAQWVFLKPYLQEHTDFYMTLLLEVPADVPAENRFIWCQAAVMDDGRTIQKYRWRKINLSE